MTRRVAHRRGQLRLVLALVAAVGAIAFVAALVTAGAGNGGQRVQVVPVDQRQRAPQLPGPWLVGPPVRISSSAGRVLVINFWASWCGPCRREAPELERFDREMRGRARLVGVDVQDAEGDARRFIRTFGWAYPNASDRAGSLTGRYGPVGLPTTFIVDRKGRIALELPGPQRYERLVEAVDEIGSATPG